MSAPHMPPPGYLDRAPGPYLLDLSRYINNIITIHYFCYLHHMSKALQPLNLARSPALRAPYSKTPEASSLPCKDMELAHLW